MEAITTVLSYLLPIALALGILVFVHELGHFLAAKLFGMRVEQFSIGFPPKVLSKKLGETEYRIGATPLGGYVKISGMIDESLDADYSEREPEPWEFRSKPVWQRIVVITAGVIFNLLLAAAIFIGLKFAYGESYIPADQVPSVYVEDGSVAYKIGFRSGDKIQALNGRPIERFDEVLGLRALVSDQAIFTVVRDGQVTEITAPKDLATLMQKEAGNGVFGAGIYGEPYIRVLSVSSESPGSEAGLRNGDRILLLDGYPVRVSSELIRGIQASEGRDLKLTVSRDSEEGPAQMVLTVTPELGDEGYRIGVGIATVDLLFSNPNILKHQPYGMGEAIVAGLSSAWESTVATVQSFRKIVAGSENVRDSVGGPVMIGKITKEALDRGWEQFWFLVAMLSITLAIINILPIPALDGGHLVFLIYEGIVRKEPSVKFRMAVQQIGMVMILGLMVFLIVNDILKL